MNSLTVKKDFESSVNGYPQSSTNWRAIIIAIYGAKCFVTGEAVSSGEPLEALYCQSTFPEKSLYVTNNKRRINKKINTQ